jgi:hypothetical protein
MQIETIGKYQIHLIALQISDSGRWDPFVTILKFDNQTGDFKCVLEKRRASSQPLGSYEEAIEAARRFGNAHIEAGHL